MCLELRFFSVIFIITKTKQKKIPVQKHSASKTSRKVLDPIVNEKSFSKEVVQYEEAEPMEVDESPDKNVTYFEYDTQQFLLFKKKILGQQKVWPRNSFKTPSNRSGHCNRR